jgi:hypothetical protein
MFAYIVGIAVVGIVIGGYYYQVRRRKTNYVAETLDLPEFDELIVDFEEDEIQQKITKMHEF